jgi:group I intron endonuclease
MAVIYKIESLCKPDRIYIGSAHQFSRRKIMHLYHLKVGDHHSPKLQRHYNKYGKGDLIFSVMEVFDPISKKCIVDKEQYYLDLFNPWFNICKFVTKSRKGLKNSPQHRRNISMAKIGGSRPPASEETREKHRQRMMGEKNPMFNKPKSKETAEKISSSLKEYFESEEGREHTIRVNKFNEGNSYHTGHMHSDEAKHKMSIAKKGKPQSEERKEQNKQFMLAYWATHTMSEERKQHIREGVLRYNANKKQENSNENGN